MVIPNKRRATRHGPILGATRRAGAALARSGVAPRLCGMTTSHSLRLVSRQSGHRRVDQICVNRPLPLFPYIFPICASKASKSVLTLAGFKSNRCFAIEHHCPTDFKLWRKSRIRLHNQIVGLARGNDIVGRRTSVACAKRPIGQQSLEPFFQDRVNGLALHRGQ